MRDCLVSALVRVAVSDIPQKSSMTCLHSILAISGEIGLFNVRINVRSNTLVNAVSSKFVTSMKIRSHDDLGADFCAFGKTTGYECCDEYCHAAHFAAMLATL